VRLPVDETTATFCRIFRKVYEIEKTAAVKMAGKAIGATVGTVAGKYLLPNVNPPLAIIANFLTMTMGVNPPTATGGKLIPEQAWKAGGDRILAPFLKSIYNTVSPTNSLYRFREEASSEIYGEKFNKPQGIAVSDDLVGVLSDMLDLPFAQSMVRSGFITKSDRGHTEAVIKASEEVESATAETGMLMEEVLRAKLKGNHDAVTKAVSALKDLSRSSDINQMIVASQIDKWDTKLKNAVLGGNSDQAMAAFMRSSVPVRLMLIRRGIVKFTGGK
jgi:hypothetical protein